MLAIKALYSRAYLSLLSSRYSLFSKIDKPHIQQPSQPSASKQLSDSAQKAIVAFQIMNLILQEKMPKSFQGQSLSEQIISLGPKIGKYQIKSSIRQQFNEMFTSGIHLNSEIYTQDRVWDAIQGIVKAKKKIAANAKNKFIFFPTRLTTGQIFQILTQTNSQKIFNERDFFVTGGFGIGKTISIILYSKLSYYIHAYHQKFIEANQNSQPTELDKKLVSEYNQLINQEQLYIVPKCLYWTIRKKFQQNNLLSIEELILQQVEELSIKKRKLLQECIQSGDITSFSNKLKNLYPEVHLKVVVDQLNVLVGIVREYNRHQAQRRSGTLRDIVVKTQNGKSKVETVKDQEIQQNIRIKKMIILMKHLEDYRECGHNAIFFSSVNIERELLQASTPEKIGIQIYGKNWHEIPFQRTIEFQNLLREVSGANIIFWQFFYFQIERRLLSLKASSQQLAIIKKAFFDKCEQSNAQVNSYFRLVYIRIFFEQRGKLLSNILKIKEQTQLSEQLGNLIENFQKYCVQNTINKFNKFLNKQDDKLQKSSKINFLLRLYQNALNCFNQKDKKDNQNKENQENQENKENNQNLKTNQKKKDSLEKKHVIIEPSILDRFLKRYIKPYVSSDTVEYQMDREFFAFQEMSTKKVRLLLGPKQVVEILYDVLFPRIAELIPFGRYYQEFVEKYKAPRGFQMEHTFLQCLIEGVKVTYEVQWSFSKKLSTKIFQRKEFNICGKTEFTSLKTVKKQQAMKINSVKECFEALLEKAKLKPGQHLVGIPYKNRNEGYVFDDQSPSVDFVIGCYDKGKDIFNLSTFDLTIGKTVDQKQSDAINLLQNLLKKEQRVNITHTILCPKSLIPSLKMTAVQEKQQPKTKISNPNLSIQYADIYKVNFQYDSLLAGERVHIHKQLAKLYQNLQQESERRKENQ